MGEDIVALGFWAAIALLVYAIAREWKRKRDWQKENERMNREAAEENKPA